MCDGFEMDSCCGGDGGGGGCHGSGDGGRCRRRRCRRCRCRRCRWEEIVGEKRAVVGGWGTYAAGGGGTVVPCAWKEGALVSVVDGICGKEHAFDFLAELAEAKVCADQLQLAFVKLLHNLFTISLRFTDFLAEAFLPHLWWIAEDDMPYELPLPDEVQPRTEEEKQQHQDAHDVTLQDVRKHGLQEEQRRQHSKVAIERIGQERYTIADAIQPEPMITKKLDEV